MVLGENSRGLFAEALQKEVCKECVSGCRDDLSLNHMCDEAVQDSSVE